MLPKLIDARDLCFAIQSLRLDLFGKDRVVMLLKAQHLREDSGFVPTAFVVWIERVFGQLASINHHLPGKIAQFHIKMIP